MHDEASDRGTHTYRQVTRRSRAFFLLARPLGVWVALAGSGVSTAAKAFMAWFGPKGVATMTFSLFVLAENVPGGSQIFNLAALAVFASILVHGLTDAPGVDWIARREPPDDDDAPDRGPQAPA